jgi:uncharacterized protein (TIGR03086 family)
MSESLLSFVGRAVDAIEPLVGSVTAVDHQRRTPCPDFDLKSLTAHLIAGLSGFADVAEGKQWSFGGDPDLSIVDAALEFRLAANRLIDGFSKPGVIERTFSMPWGETPGAQLVGFELIELLVHGWDIARSLDRLPVYDDELVAAALFGARQWVDDSARVPQLFGPEVIVTTDGPVLDQLVGFLGREPTWKPAAFEVDQQA